MDTGDDLLKPDLQAKPSWPARISLRLSVGSMLMLSQPRRNQVDREVPRQLNLTRAAHKRLYWAVARDR
jgi:hypothetical protein